MQVKIIGSGVWGKALYSVVRQNCSDVTFLKRNESSSDQDILILSVPTQSIRDALKNITFSGQTKIIINTSKGIEKETHFLPWKIVQEVVSEDIEYYTLVGPSFAQEVADKMPTLVNLGFKKETENNQKIKELFQTDFFRVRLSKGVEVLEISGAFKNIYAIACGLADGLGYKTNTRVKLMVLAMEEMNTLYQNLNLKVDPNMIAGTFGDLILTCNSTESRNFSFGSLLAHLSVDDSLKKINSTVEGLHSLLSIDYFKKLTGTELPLATFVSKIVANNTSELTKKDFKDFITSR